MNRQIVATLLCMLSMMPATAQQYLGTSGLIHVPSADMDSVPIVRAGVHYLPQEMMPAQITFENERYNSGTYYLGITPFRWIEIGYSRMLLKLRKAPTNMENPPSSLFYGTDRQFSVRIQPLREGRWWPSVVIGGNDIWGSRGGSSDSFYFRNYYLAVSKHLDLSGWLLGGHVSYRRFKDDNNAKWNGVVGGFTLRPSFFRPLKAICEYDGDRVNIGMDCLLFKHLQLQTSLIDCRYFTGGACVIINL